jgi:hypothetical protein
MSLIHGADGAHDSSEKFGLPADWDAKGKAPCVVQHFAGMRTLFEAF